MERTIFEDSHEAFRAACRTFIEREVDPIVGSLIESKGIPRSLWEAAGRAGLLGLEIPEAFGGSEADDFRFNAVLAEELSRVNLALAGCLGIHADVVAPYLVGLGTPEQHARWLPGCASGQTLTAIGMTEPSGGTDLASLRSAAIRDGDTWAIRGTKTFITNGGSADLVLVAVRTSDDRGAKGISLFVVEATDPGFSRGPALDKVGQDEADTSELFFDDVRVGRDRLIGPLDRGFLSMMQNLPQERLACAVANLAHARQILVETIDYCHQRKAFGQSIGSFQHAKFQIAEKVTSIDVAQAFVDAAMLAHTHKRLSAVDAAKAKWWSAQVQNEVLDTCVQLYGGYGYMNEYRVARAWRDARVTKIWAGTNEILKELIGRDLGF